MIEINKLYTLGALEGLRMIDDKKVDLIVTDPPFNQNKDYASHDDSVPEKVYFEWCEKWIKEGFRVLKDTGSFYCQINSKNMIKLGSILDKYGIFQNACIWIKHYNPTPTTHRYAKNYQTWLFYTKTDNFKFYANSELIQHRYEPYKNNAGRNNDGRRVDDIWEDIPELTAGYLGGREVLYKDGSKERLHKQQMPIALANRMILHSSEPNDLVLDFFVGSGTTTLSAYLNKRNYIGFDNNPENIKIADKRIYEIPDIIRKVESPIYTKPIEELLA